MYLQAKHKEFAVSSYAKFMTRKQGRASIDKRLPTRLKQSLHHTYKKTEPKWSKKKCKNRVTFLVLTESLTSL